MLAGTCGGDDIEFVEADNAVHHPAAGERTWLGR